jgi:Flp pilus assembly protein CpaB
MKKNMVPLLGIAFVVAIICTGVFYGLFAGRLHSKPADVGQNIVVAARALDRGTVLAAADLQVSQVKGSLAGGYSKVSDAVGETLLEPLAASEPLLQSRVASRDAKTSGAGAGIASGMRAVSIRVAESSGLMSLIHEGSRVDVQVASERTGTPQLRTILQNMEVLRVSPQLEPAGNGRPVIPIITLLVPAPYADLIALADTGARIRLALRNPLDDGALQRHAIGLASLFEGGSMFAAANTSATPAVAQSANRTVTPSADKTVAQRANLNIELHVQVLDASPAALGELTSKLAVSNDSGSLPIVALRAGADASELVRKLEQAHELEVVSSKNLTAIAGQTVSVRRAASPYQLRIQFSSAVDKSGQPSLRVAPELSERHGAGVETHRFDAAVPQDASFLLKGLIEGRGDSGTAARLFPGHSWTGRELVVLVIARSPNQLATSVAHSNRGQ